MNIKVTHDLHRRQFGRNLGVGLALAGFVALVMGLTVVKVTSDGFTIPTIQASE